MLAEMGSLRSEGRQSEWFKNALSVVKRKFPEIKAFVLFNSGLDKNLPVDTNIQYLDWRISNPQVFLTSNDIRPTSGQIPFLASIPNNRLKSIKAADATTANFDTIVGVNYLKGLNWLKNYNTLRHKEIVADFAEIKQLGFNTIKRYGPDIYDDNILTTAQQNDLKITYGFFIPDDTDFIGDKKALDELHNTIVSTVRKLKSNTSITAWNLGNTSLQKLENYYNMPDLVYHRYAYARWLKQLVSKMKIEDPSRAISVDLEVSGSLQQTVEFLKIMVPEIDAFGFVYNDRSEEIDLNKFGFPYFVSKVSAGKFMSGSAKNAGVFLADWQDQERENLVTFDGLKDNWGRNKVTLYQLRSKLKHVSVKNPLPKVKILKPAVTIYADRKYQYHALVNIKNQWKLAEGHNSTLTYDWYLVKTDRYGNGISMKYISSGPSVSVRAPTDHKYYQLYLNASSGKDVTTARSRLSIPLIANNDGSIN